VGIIKINNEQNSLLPKSSIQYDGYPEYWQGGIEMFHQLHCLYHLRMLIYDETPDVYYGRDSTIDEPAAHVGVYFPSWSIPTLPNGYEF
jgi:hypothetical protein